MRPTILVSTNSSYRNPRMRLIPRTCKAEEIKNAPFVIPLSIGVSTLLNGSLGFAMLIALLFCMPDDIPSILNSETYYPFMSIYTYAVGSKSGATAMVSLSNVVSSTTAPQRPLIFQSTAHLSHFRRISRSYVTRSFNKIPGNKQFFLAYD